MYKRVCLASMMLALAGCGSSSDSSSDTDSSSNTDAVITGTTAIELYYKGGDVSDSLDIEDPDEGEEAFIEQSESSTSYGLFSISESGDWTYQVLENETLGDMESDESVTDSVRVYAVDGTSVTITFTILSADANPDDEDSSDDDDSEEQETDSYTCSDAIVDDGSTDANPVVTGSTYYTDVDDLNDLLDSVEAGDEIIVSGSGEISIKNVCFDSHVLIRAESVGGVTLDKAAITDSQNIILQGFVFGPNEESTLVKVVNSKNIKVLRNLFDHDGVSEGQSSVVLTESSEYISIAYNEFIDKNVSDVDGELVSGSYIKFQYDDDYGLMTTNAHIHHNYFSNITPYLEDDGDPAGDSDREAIVFGDSDSQDVETNHIVEYNLFENCDGENEIMTVKTSNNTFRYNTFLNSMGSLSLRLGHDNEVYGNQFYGSGDSDSVDDENYQTGGIRVYGANHVIYDNYMQGLSGTSWRLPLLIDSGDVSDSSNGNSHETPNNVTVSDNIIIDSVGGIHIGSDNYSQMPSDISIDNNIVAASEGILFNNYAEDESNTWSGNQAYATDEAIANGGGELDSDELQILSSYPSFESPTALTDSDVGTDADL